jgi:hypothetical protein
MATKRGEGTTQSRNLAFLAKDVMEGYLTLNPLVLKKYDETTSREIYRQLRKLQTTIRMEGVDLGNQATLRTRNHRLQRMHQALSVLEYHAKLNKILLG